jgi:diketogulonate reductase-like aldo/keto reductase
MARTQPPSLPAIPVDNRKIRLKRTGKRDDIFLCSKFGVIHPTYQIDGSPEYVKKVVESSLKKLAVDCMDLYYLHVRSIGLCLSPFPVHYDTVAGRLTNTNRGTIHYLFQN